MKKKRLCITVSPSAIMYIYALLQLLSSKKAFSLLYEKRQRSSRRPPPVRVRQGHAEHIQPDVPDLWVGFLEASLHVPQFVVVVGVRVWAIEHTRSGWALSQASPTR